MATNDNDRFIIGDLFGESALITIRTQSKDILIPYQYYDPARDTVDRGYDISVDYKDSESNEMSTGEVVIFNLNKSDMSLIRDKDTINVQMGYGRDIGEVFTATITEVIQLDYQLKIKFIEASKDFNSRVSIGLEPTKASKAIRQIADSIGFVVKKMQLKKDKEYRGGFYLSPFDVPIRKIMQIVNDCDSKINIKYDEIYIFSQDSDDAEKIILNKTSGLLNEPKKYVKPEKAAAKNRGEVKKAEKDKKNRSSKRQKTPKTESPKERKVEYDYTVNCLLIHYLKKTDNVIIESDTFTGKAKIVALSIKDFEMELKIKVLNEVKKK